MAALSIRRCVTEVFSSIRYSRILRNSSVTVNQLAWIQEPTRLASSTSNPGDSGPQSTERAPLKKAFTPVGKHDETIPDKHRDAEKEPLAPFPDDVNPATGEKGGPRGPEPTRYGDWERKGRCIDF